jgi:hypothetical protein
MRFGNNYKCVHVKDDELKNETIIKDNQRTLQRIFLSPECQAGMRAMATLPTAAAYIGK